MLDQGLHDLPQAWIRNVLPAIERDIGQIFFGHVGHDYTSLDQAYLFERIKQLEFARRYVDDLRAVRLSGRDRPALLRRVIAYLVQGFGKWRSRWRCLGAVPWVDGLIQIVARVIR
jgi:hypothetical protein